MFFFKNYTENKAGKLVPHLFLLFKIYLYEIKVSGLQLSLNIYGQPSTWTYNKNKLYKILDN